MKTIFQQKKKTEILTKISGSAPLNKYFQQYLAMFSLGGGPAREMKKTLKIKKK